MNYLIVVPRIVNKPGDFYQFPQGLAYISAVMSKAGFRVFKLNLNHTTLPVSQALEEAITANNIGVLLTGGLTGQYGSIRSVLEVAKKANPDIRTIVGGGIITSAPLYAMQALEFADYGVIGEGENTVCALCAALETERCVATVPGVIYEKSSGYVITEGEPETVDVNRIPFPDYEGMGLRELMQTVPNIVGMSEENTFPIITSRGCPFRCTFCFHPSGQKYRQRSLDHVFAEIDYLVREYQIKYLAIQDELFGNNMDYVSGFCNRIKPYNIKWWAQFRVTEITPALVALLKDANCVALGFGVESADNRILQSMNKKITVEETERALELVHQCGLGIQGCLIFGDIAETVETADNSFRWWEEHIHYGLQLSLVVTYPGTYLFQYACRNDLIHDPVQFIKDSCPTVKLSKMSKKEYAWMLGKILSLQRTALSLPKESRVVRMDFENACMDLAGKCGSCHSENVWNRVRFFISESLICKSCGRRHYAPIPDELTERIVCGLASLSKTYDKISFWGINSYFYELCRRMEGRHPGYLFFTDQSEVRHGMIIPGGTVQPTDVIRDKNIQCVIVAVPQYYANLQPVIRKEYPGVERLLNISELTSDEFA